ncbi:MAG: hypothetical protein ABH890_02425 [Bacillota bacterium]
MANNAKENVVKTTKKTVVSEKTIVKKNAQNPAEKTVVKKNAQTPEDKTAIKKHFQTPTETWWGKLIVWIIMFGMVGLIILSFVLAILKGTA